MSEEIRGSKVFNPWVETKVGDGEILCPLPEFVNPGCRLPMSSTPHGGQFGSQDQEGREDVARDPEGRRKEREERTMPRDRPCQLTVSVNTALCFNAPDVPLTVMV